MAGLEKTGLCPKCKERLDFDYKGVEFCNKCDYICVVMSTGFGVTYKKGVKTESNKMLGYAISDIVSLLGHLHSIREDFDLDEGEMSET